MNEDYLQVNVSLLGGDLMVESANGESLAKGSGCFFAFIYDIKSYPLFTDYSRYLENQGWKFVSSNTIFINQFVYIFKGGREYKVRWEGDHWYGINDGYSGDDLLNDGPDDENWWNL